MFDSIFGVTRRWSLADVHGYIPLEILAKILPLFKIWII